MFGNSWTNPQQNQQQQQPGTSAFGQQQPNAFGSGGTGAFGGGAFGQQSQPQQPAVNPMFGGTTNTANTSGTSGFGAFGGGGTSAFGAPKPTGFGAFGGGSTGTSAFGGGGTGAFGQTNAAGTSGTSAFGQPAGGTSAFGGTGNSLFGQKPAAPTGAFGSTSTGPATGTGEVNVAPVTTGSSNPPYNAFTEKDGAATLHYQSITMMPAYRGSSFEEIRFQDYAQGRKTAGAFGQSASFGMTPSQSTTSAFGQPAAASTSAFGGFGQTAQQPAPQQPSAFGTFGQPAASQPSAFGAGAGTSAFGGFGQNNQQQQQQQQQQPAAPSVFGTGAFGQNTQQQQPQAGTSAFGSFGQTNNTQPKPFGSFGSGTGTSAFGGFGQANSQPAGQTGTTGNIFGQPASQAQPTNAFSAFGANNNAQKSAFGQPAAQPATTGFGLFGQQNQQQQQQQQPNQQQGQQPSTGLFGNTGASTGTGLFGQPNNQQQGQQNPAQPSTGLFGQQQAQPASTGLFGNTNTGAGMFGNNNNQPKPGGFGTNLFGANNNQANTGTNQPSTGMFGQPMGQSTAQSAPGSNAFGASLFGQKPANNNAFGQSTAQPASNGFGNSLFGNSTLGGVGGGYGQSTMGTGGQQGGGTLTASVAQPVQDNLPIFTLLHGPSKAASIAPLPKKPTNFFADVPMRTPLALSQSRYGAGTVPGRLRGFNISQSAAGLSRRNLAAAALANSKNNLALSKSDGKAVIGPDSFLGNSSSFGSGGMSSPKKLILDRKIDPQEIFGRSVARQQAAAAKAKVSFNPAMSIAAREREAQAQTPKPTDTTSPSATSPGRRPTPLARDPSDLQDGDYYVTPSLDVLRRKSNSELAHFEGLVVGRKNYGEIQFLEPVDLTTLPKLKDLLGKLIQIHKKKTNEVIVYPDTPDDEQKPRPGEGINVPARITLTGCWPKDKATGAILKDDKAPIFQKHLKKLKSIKHTHFESYDVKEGKWTFTVDHF